MKKPQNQGPIDVLAQIYEKLFESVVKNFHNKEEKSGALLHKLIDEAKEDAVKLEEISREDAEKLSDYLRRDLSDAASYLSETGGELRDWLGFETVLLETEILDQLLNTADPTTVELFKLKLDAQQTPAYHTGEITGPGTLVCDQCGEKLHFYKAGKIPPCPKCHATSFHRKIEV
jgi:hypothetical protein